jgi:hypothetical protein
MDRRLIIPNQVVLADAGKGPEMTEQRPRHDEAALRFKLRLLIKHPTIDPDTITKQLDRVPNLTQRAGSKRKTPTGTELAGTYPVSAWQWSERFETDDFGTAISHLIEQLQPRAALFHEIVETGGRTQLILDLPGARNIGSYVGSQTLKQMAELKLDFGLEVFPDL